MSRPFDFMLTEPEKEKFAQYTEEIDDGSLSSKIMSPFWERVALLVPSNVAPNVISLAGLLCTVQAAYLCFRYMDTNPALVTVTASVLLFAYQTLDALDGIQARRTANASPVGALFDHACDNLGIVFVSLVGCYVLGITDPRNMWYTVQIFSLALVYVHLTAYKERRLRFGLLTGPGEAIFVFQLIVLSFAFFGRQRMIGMWEDFASAGPLPWVLTPQNLYFIVFGIVFARALSLPDSQKDTTRGVIFCLLFRALPALLFYMGWVNTETLLNVVCDGLFVSVIATDLALARMCKKNLHPWIWIFSMASVLNYLLILGIVVVYYMTLFYELTTYLRLPMFTLAVNVYVDGVYDLCVADDHEILTNEGFLGMKELLDAHNDAKRENGPLLIAAYDKDTKELVYERASEVIINNFRPNQVMVQFEGKGVSLLVTPEHQMYVDSESGDSYEKVEAARLVQQGVQSRFMLRAAGGVQQGRCAAPPANVCAKLGLSTEQQQISFLELYGAFVDCGSLESNGSVVVFSGNDAVLSFVRSRLAKMSGVTTTANVDESSGEIRVANADLFSVFDAEFGIKCPSSQYFCPGSPLVQKQSKWFGPWVLCNLNHVGAQAVLHGLCASSALHSSVNAASSAFSDDVIRLSLHAGIHAFVSEPWTVVLSEQVPSPVLSADEGSVLVTTFHGQTWCVRVPRGLIVARRTFDDGRVPSEPTILGNCHIGHHNIFTAALSFGNRLFVGVLSDEDVAKYKRRPVMTMDERVAVVSTCKGVSKVIPNCPFPGIPEEFLKKWNIHIVCHSPEYDKPDDIYYATPRKLGITRVLPRTDGISTSDLIKRVKAYGEDSRQKF